MPYSETQLRVKALMRSEDPTAAFEAERVLREWLDSYTGRDVCRAEALIDLSEALCRSGRHLLSFPELERAAEFATSARSQFSLWTADALCTYRAGDRRRAQRLLAQAEPLRALWAEEAPRYAPWLYRWESVLNVLLGNAEVAVEKADLSLEAAERLGVGRSEAYSAKAGAHSAAGQHDEAIFYANLAVSVSSGYCRYEALVDLLLITSRAKKTHLLDGIARQMRDTAPHPYRDVQAAFAKVVDELIQIDPLLARQFLSHFIEGKAS